MLYCARVIRLIPTVLFSLGLGGFCTQAAEVGGNAPVALITNVVAHRLVRDVIQTLLQVTPATNLSATVSVTGTPTRAASPESVRTVALRSSTNWAAAVKQARTQGVPLIINPFAGFVPGSLADVVWAGFHTNGRSTNMFEFVQLPAGWPAKPPVLRWNTNNLMWPRKGMTAISQVCEGMGAFGQGEITALTPRHAYVRGHGMGASGVHPERAGQRVWFCTRDNQVIERKVQLLLVREPGPIGSDDYSIMLFDADLPAAIEPMRVATPQTMHRKYMDYQFDEPGSKPLFMALQAGHISANVPGWTVPVRGGDSGGPVMMPLPNELVFVGGVTTSPPSAAMQANMDLLSRKAGLDPRKYQMQWINLDRYPDF